jgi:hypothetical protein
MDSWALSVCGATAWLWDCQPIRAIAQHKALSKFDWRSPDEVLYIGRCERGLFMLANPRSNGSFNGELCDVCKQPDEARQQIAQLRTVN